MQKGFASFLVVVLLFASLAAAQPSNEPYPDTPIQTPEPSSSACVPSTQLVQQFWPTQILNYFGVPARQAAGWCVGAKVQVGGEPFTIKCIAVAYGSTACGNSAASFDIVVVAPKPSKTYPAGTPVSFACSQCGPAAPTPTPTVLPSSTPTPVDACLVNADCSCSPPSRWCEGSQLKTKTAVCNTSPNPNYCSCPVSTNNCHYGCQTNAAGVASCCPRSGCAISICGNWVCDAGETSSNCPADCPSACGNGLCEVGESAVSCPADCSGACGNGVCDAGESAVSCLADCSGACGNGVCGAGETNAVCPFDCPAVCGNGVCESRETFTNCAADCPKPACSLSSDCGPTVRTCLDSSTVHVAGWNCRNPGLASAACTPWSANIYCSLHGNVCIPSGNTASCGSSPPSFLPGFAEDANKALEQVSSAVSNVLAQVSSAVADVFGGISRLFG